jgi:hypothetical protein
MDGRRFLIEIANDVAGQRPNRPHHPASQRSMPLAAFCLIYDPSRASSTSSQTLTCVHTHITHPPATPSICWFWRSPT